MKPKQRFEVRVKRVGTDEEHVKFILSERADKASAAAVRKVRASCPLAADRAYAQFEVVSCVLCCD